jgi:hypothetical protein
MKFQVAILILLSVVAHSSFLPVIVEQAVTTATPSSALIDFTTGFFIKIKAIDEIPDAYDCVLEITAAQQTFQNLTDLMRNFDISKVPAIVNLVNRTIDEVKKHCTNASTQGQAFFQGILNNLNNATFRAEGAQRLQNNWIRVFSDLNNAKRDFNNQSYTNAGMDLGDIAAIYLYPETSSTIAERFINLVEVTANATVSVQDFLTGFLVSLGALDKISHGYPCAIQLDSIKNATNTSITLVKNFTVDNLAQAVKIMGNALSDFVEQCGYATVEGNAFFSPIIADLQNATFRSEASQRLQDNWLKVLEDVNKGNKDLQTGNGFMAGMDFGDIAKIYITPVAKPAVVATL